MQDKVAELDQKHGEEAPNLIAAHVDTQQPRKVLPTQDSSQAKSDQFSVLRSDDVKPPVLNTQIYTELEGLPLAIHQPAPLPANEDERLAALKHLNVLDTAQEQRFDDITQLVCSIFSVPIAIVSLIDTERQWFKSCQGLLCNQTDRKSSFCAWTLVPKNPEVLVVPDATEDVRCVAACWVSSTGGHTQHAKHELGCEAEVS